MNNGSDGQRKPGKGSHIFGMAFLAVMCVITLYIIFKDNSIVEVWEDVKRVDPVYLGLALLMSALSVFLLGYALYMPMRTLCGKAVKLGDGLVWSMIGSYYSAITPSSTGGQPMQLYSMYAEGVSLPMSSLSLLLVNIAYQSVVLLFPLLMFLFKSELVISCVRDYFWLLVFGVTVSVAVIGFILFGMFSRDFAARLCRGVIRFLGRLHIVKDSERTLAKWEGHIANYRKGAEVLRTHPKLMAKVFVTYLLQLGTLYAIPYFIYRSFGLSGYNLPDFLALQSVLYLAVCFLPLPGAQGATERVFTVFFGDAFSESSLVSALLLYRMVSFYLPLIVSFAVTMVTGLRRRKRTARMRGEGEEANSGEAQG